jgi:hypothetical protein
MVRVKSVKFRVFLHDAGHALESHAGVHVPGGQRGKRAVGIGVELDEDEVPNLDATGVAFVDKRAPVSPAGVRSTWISLHGPQGPVSPIIQKLSFLPPLTMWTLGSRPAAVNLAAQKS